MRIFAAALLFTMATAASAAPSLVDQIRHPGAVRLAQYRQCHTTCTRDPFPPYTQRCSTQCF